jgi:hypothetical protein
MTKVMIGAIWRESSNMIHQMVPLTILASFYDMPNTFGPDAAMETNDFGRDIIEFCSKTMADVRAVFSCIRYILACMPPTVILETRVVRS